MVLRKLKDRLRSKFNFSISEIDHQELWQRAMVGAVSISADRKSLESVTEAFVRESEAILGEGLTQCQIEYIEF